MLFNVHLRVLSDFRDKIKTFKTIRVILLLIISSTWSTKKAFFLSEFFIIYAGAYTHFMSSLAFSSKQTHWEIFSEACTESLKSSLLVNKNNKYFFGLCNGIKSLCIKKSEIVTKLNFSLLLLPLWRGSKSRKQYTNSATAESLWRMKMNCSGWRFELQHFPRTCETLCTQSLSILIKEN